MALELAFPRKTVLSLKKRPRKGEKIGLKPFPGSWKVAVLQGVEL